MIRTDRDRASASPEVRTPTVLAVLVVKDGLSWLRECLQGLSSQGYGRLAMLAVDNGSTDGSADLLERALGSRRVRRLERDAGVAGAVRAALEMPMSEDADYILVLHDDTALEPDTVARLVEAAEGIDRVGIVGPKVVDWDDPHILREVGRSTDRFGHPATALQDGEVDHGQYDRVLEVLFVSSCAMLVRGDVWQRAGQLDERMTSHHEDLDFCWRARLAGYRVVMTPLARVRHADASARGERSTEVGRRGERYRTERASLAAMLKNYGVPSLLWLLPLYAVLGVARVLLLCVSRRLDEAYDIVAAWGWNVARLPGTVRRRTRAQSVRAVPDREIRRFMESASVRLPRWIDEATVLLGGTGGFDEDEPPAQRLRAQTRSLVRAHPALAGAALAIVVGGFLAGPVLGAEQLSGGVLPAFPSSASGFFGELASGVRTTGLGGTQAATPALAALGALSWLLLGSTSFAQRLLVVALPALAGVLCYRAVVRSTGDRLGATVAAAAYLMSAVVLWSYSQGRIDLLVALAAAPVLLERAAAAFDASDRGVPRRLAAGLAVTIAIGVAFFPGLLLATAVVVVVYAFMSSRRGVGIATAGIGVLGAGLLLFPIAGRLVLHAAPSLTSFVGRADFAALVRTELGPGPATWVASWFLPIGAALALVVVRREHRAPANRLAVVGVAVLFLAWLSTARYLPDALTNAPAYGAVLAACEALLIGYGVAAVARGLRTEAFGARQIAGVALTAVLVLGLSLQALGAVTGGRDIGDDGLPAAWPVVAGDAAAPFRVLWLGRADGMPFPAPGGDPAGVLDASTSSLRYGLTDANGVSALDLARAASGPGYDALERVLVELVSGRTDHVGSLLAPFGVRFVVAGGGDLPPAVRLRLDNQLDLDRVPALGLRIYRDPRPFPEASSVGGDTLAPFLSATTEPTSATGDLTSLSMLRTERVSPLTRAPGGWTGPGPGRAGSVFVSQQLAAGWRLRVGGATREPVTAFGWGIGFGGVRGGEVRVDYSRQWIRTWEVVVLALVWMAALWITRKPVAS